MGSISVACYKPKPGCAGELLELVRNQMPPLCAQGLVTDRTPIVMRTADGTADAHTNPAVLELWKRFEQVCTYETPSNLAEFQNMFAHFEPI
jgi:hypothetical protein